MKVLRFAAVVEVGTGLALMIDPALVVSLLLGADLSGELMSLGRVAGVALLALGLACWAGGQPTGSDSPAFRAMLTYNVLIALYLTYLGTAGHQGGLLLWPAVVLHAVVTLLLIQVARNEQRTRSSSSS